MPEATESTAVPRHDPQRRPVDGDLRADMVIGKAKDRHYCFVDKNNATQMSYYAALGYIPETYRKGGPRPLLKAHTSTDGAEIEVMGHILMSCPLEWQQERFLAGQRGADEIDKKILRPGGVDNLRGFSGVAITHETTLER